MGVPVLISKTVVSCATFVEHYQVGWVVENNPDGIETNSLLRLQGEIRQLLNTEQLTPLRERCRQSAELLKFSQYENDYLELYQEIFHDKVGKP
jgi:glycosyltransferase involved in cell wall biosynthesis